jgi:predicted DNA-binding transcriptional regulator YafY
VAEGTRHENDGVETLSIQDLATRHGVSVAQINKDLQALTDLDKRSNADWRSSISIFYGADEVSVSSRGPFRRPVRLTPEEQLAVQMALVLDPHGRDLATRLAPLWARNGARTQSPATPATEARDGDVTDMIRSAIREHVTLKLEYASAGDDDVKVRSIHPHQLVESGIRTYIVAWDEDVGAWRHFRLDRIVSCELTASRFNPRDDFMPVDNPRDTFRPSGEVEEVTVRFHPDAAHWAKESFSDHVVEPDGAVLVRFAASSVEWMIRRVLEFGADAEVVAPARYRDAVRRAVA